MKQKEETKRSVRLVRLCSAVASAVLVTGCLVILLFAGYAKWDSAVVVKEALASAYAQYKPAEETLGYDELRAINPEVVGWLTVYGTTIDYPVVQASNNYKYLATNALGETTLTGALFLDYRNAADFSDFNSIIYGHNMTPQVMFGMVRDFLDEDVFLTYEYGNLYYGGRDYGLRIFAVIQADGYDQSVYNPGAADGEAYLSLLLSKAVYTRDIGEVLPERILLMSSCSSEDTNGRNILLAAITEETYEDSFAGEEEKPLFGVDVQELFNRLPVWAWVGLLGALLLVLSYGCVWGIRRFRRYCRRASGKKDGHGEE